MGGGGGGGAMGGAGGMSTARRSRKSSKAGENLTRLRDVIQNAVKPESWAELGGFGTIAEFDGLLIINHNVQAHRKIERVLEILRKALKHADKPTPKGYYIPAKKKISQPRKAGGGPAGSPGR